MRVGIVYCIYLDMRGFWKILWEYFKCLLFGLFFCLLKDNFIIMFFVMVVNCKFEDFRFGRLDICFVDGFKVM